MEIAFEPMHVVHYMKDPNSKIMMEVLDLV